MPRDVEFRDEDDPNLWAKPEVKEYRIKLVTPMFGGGAVAGEPDAAMPIRATAIRGQLQFWWRATRGAALPLEEMRRRHQEVWGSTERASPVKVEVDDVKASLPVACGRYEGNAPRITWTSPFSGTSLPYALFPFQGVNTGPDHKRKPPAKCVHEASFTLRVRCEPPLKEDVDAALWAWVNFGGLGARTRRGCGALWCEDFSPRPGKVEEWFRTNAALHLRFSTARDRPTLLGKLFARREAGPPLKVWDRWLTGLLQRFRQGAEFARTRHQGRSLYPEPETIRRMTGRRSARHQRMEGIDDRAFPRAELGLPIIFQFKDEKAGDPQKTSLQPLVAGKPGERMGSPLILKPLAVSPTQAVPMIVRLIAPAPDAVVLMDGKKEVGQLGPDAIRDPRLATPGSPLAASHAGSALEAFLAFARNDGFQEVIA
ncbi:MAG: type III-B CRISPR module RAMP protein Cmr1 [Gemmataceae bacterium]|nr:type III-B CRISPR module RAMP protein Cmr1 [Gemmataceae bacterium]